MGYLQNLFYEHNHYGHIIMCANYFWIIFLTRYLFYGQIKTRPLRAKTITESLSRQN